MLRMNGTIGILEYATHVWDHWDPRVCYASMELSGSYSMLRIYGSIVIQEYTTHLWEFLEIFAKFGQLANLAPMNDLKIYSIDLELQLKQSFTLVLDSKQDQEDL